MILDPLLVLGVGPFPRLEVIGAAVATVTAQIVVLLILVAEILRDHGEANVLHKIRLLSRPDMKIQDVAGASGFSDASHFIAMFRKVTGTTPLDFRKYVLIYSYCTAQKLPCRKRRRRRFPAGQFSSALISQMPVSYPIF